MQTGIIPNSEDKKPSLEHDKLIKYKAKEDVNLPMPLPIYKSITASYLPSNTALKPHDYIVYNSTENGFVIAGVTQGVPVTSSDFHEMRQARQGLVGRRAIWNYTRRVQSFVCLNVFYAVVLIISLNASFSDYRDYKQTCPNFAYANLLYGFLGIAWIVVSTFGIFASIKKSATVLQIYIVGLYGILLITIVVTGYGLIAPDKNPECESEPPKSISLIGSGLFTVVILSLFAYTAIKLKKSIRELFPPLPIIPPQQGIELPAVI